jgi:hypothetical protein
VSIVFPVGIVVRLTIVGIVVIFYLGMTHLGIARVTILIDYFEETASFPPKQVHEQISA